MKINENSILTASIPPEKGVPLHFEHWDDTAFTRQSPSDKVEEIHTPQDTVVRIHEWMHAQHTTMELKDKLYVQHGIMDQVAQIIEDCRLHVFEWPWSHGKTPACIEDDSIETIKRHLRMADDSERKLKEAGHESTSYGPFAMRLRAVCMWGAITNDNPARRYFNGLRERAFASTIIEQIQRGRISYAARLLQDAFFPSEHKETSEGSEKEFYTKETGVPGWNKISCKYKTRKGTETHSGKPPSMQIIELPHTKTIKDEAVGSRVAKTGTRIYRPALRKPILPERMFIKRARKYPGGTILVDASSSMGDWDDIIKWCEESPHALLAYYAGSDNVEEPWGQLFIYARDGMRSEKLVMPALRGNSIDGLAMDWLMEQTAPRVFITDRGFCGCYDSPAQKMRLNILEEKGEITVRDYRKDK